MLDRTLASDRNVRDGAWESAKTILNSKDSVPLEDKSDQQAANVVPGELSFAPV